MANSKKRRRAARSGQTPPGVWNRGTGSGPSNPIRIRTKRLDEIDSDKIALAYWLLAKQIVEDGTGEKITEAEARRVAAELERTGDAGSGATRQQGRKRSGTQT
jgi:hypothetical protein